MKPDTSGYLWGPVLVLVIALSATAAVVWQVLRMADSEDSSRFQRHVAVMHQAIEEQHDAYLRLLREVATLFAGNREPEAVQFREYVKQLKVSSPDIAPRARRMQSSAAPAYPGVLGVGWLRINNAPSHPARAPELRVSLDDEVLHLVHMEPREWWRNQSISGLEMFNDPETVATIERARDTGKAAMSGKLTVIREFWARSRSGFHVFLPLYRGGSVPNSVAARRRALRGLLVISVEAEEMIAALRPQENRGVVAMQVYDGEQTSAAALLYSSDSSQPMWEANYRPRFSATGVAHGPGRSWSTVFYTLPEFELVSSRGTAPNVLLIGILVSLLLAGINLIQRRASAALNASEVRYRRLFEASPDGVFLFDADSGLISNVNPAMTELLGRPREQLVGRYLWEIGLFADEAAGRAAFKHLQDKNYHRFHDLPVTTPAGKHHDVEFTCNAYMANNKRFMQCNIRNVTDRRRAESALRDSEERYRSLVEVSPQGVWIVDREGNPLFINRYWVEYSGVDLRAGANGGWVQQVHPDDRERVLEQWRQARSNDSFYEAELRVRRACDGAYRWHLARGVPVPAADGSIDKWLGVFIDIDERKQAEQARVQQLERETALRTQSEAANRAKDDFLAALSHELRTPLNAILGWTQTLQNGDADRATVQRALAQIDASANAQAKLINDLLNIADIGSGRLRLDIQQVNLIALVDPIVESLRAAITAREITFTTAIDPDAGRVPADPARMQQILWNLLSNAVKFARQGGQIRFGVARVDEQLVEICVEDDGEGISSEFLPYVFDAFRQADASTKRRHGGLGLGLAIVRHLTELHGGSVSADSKGEGRGSRFRVRLPLRAVRTQEAGATALPAERRQTPANLVTPRAKPRRRLAGLRILSVDDDPNTREMLQEALERDGAVVECAASASEALQKLRGFAPHVLLSDIGLPEEDGYDLMRKVRALDVSEGGRVPAVALTGYAREQDFKAAMAAGYQAFVAKPVNLEELASAILRAHGPQK